MKAIAYQHAVDSSHKDYLVEIEQAMPTATGHDILVKVAAIAVNPVDCKIRKRFTPEQGEHRILGWDAVGEVVAKGEKVSQFTLGDTVYYAGALNRPGSNSEFQLVDARIVGKKPASISHAEAAALPLTSITAWEMAFEHLNLVQQQQPSDEVLLITGAAGGVGSILIQLVKALTGATVIATASRLASQQWVKELGADYVIDHSQNLVEQVKALGIERISHVASLNATHSYYSAFIELLAPFGKIAMIDDPATPLDIMQLKQKSLSLHIEFMFAKSLFDADNIASQGALLNNVAQLVDEGRVRTTLGKHLGEVNVENLVKAHQMIEQGQVVGKLVLEY